MTEWRPISTAPEFERIIVCGWQKPHGTTRGYWWWHETELAKGLKPEFPAATHWCYPNLPPFPDREVKP